MCLLWSKFWPNCFICEALKVRLKMSDYCYPWENQQNLNLLESPRNSISMVSTNIYDGSIHIKCGPGWNCSISVGLPWDKLLCFPGDNGVNPELALSCSLYALLAVALKLRERRKYGCFRDSLAGRSNEKRNWLGNSDKRWVGTREKESKSRKDDMGSRENWTGWGEDEDWSRLGRQ